ncbi:hypothetical protein HDF16_005304 [Granulicella aggregans]|uniref:Uncharacterized protein n=1 Tax=Granulicella aggregans TaxID=474949 RepID=A0A7W7ZIU9_9BACT|nr:hypothetical protein [Granulicella aggregans]MBB5060568.1 hypothetical protein [Granulicella aggregans]
MPAVGSSDRQILNPIGSNSTLRFPDRHLSRSDFRGEVILNEILLFEVALAERDIGWTTLRPDVAHAIRAAEFQRHEVIQLTGLILP